MNDILSWYEGVQIFKALADADRSFCLASVCRVGIFHISELYYSIE